MPETAGKTPKAEKAPILNVQDEPIFAALSGMSAQAVDIPIEVITELESERKLILSDEDQKNIPFETAWKTAEISQRYVEATERGEKKPLHFRMRMREEKNGVRVFLAQLKQKVEGTVYTKKEAKCILSENDFWRLLKQGSGYAIKKTRHYFVHVGASGRVYNIHVDVFHHDEKLGTHPSMEGKILVEVECGADGEHISSGEVSEYLTDPDHRKAELPAWLVNAEDLFTTKRNALGTNWNMAQNGWGL